MTPHTIEEKRLQKILNNHFDECFRCGRIYNNANEMFSSKNGCPRKCSIDGQYYIGCKSCEERNNSQNTNCKKCGVTLK